MRIYKYKLASEYVIIFVIYLELLFYVVPNFAIDIVRQGVLADHNVMSGYHTREAPPNKKNKWLQIFEK